MSMLQVATVGMVKAYKIVLAPNKILSTRCHGEDMPAMKIVQRMVRTLHTLNGVGLAAPQVGFAGRFFVMKEMPKESITLVVNPIVLHASEETDVRPEGCLSIPKLQLPVKRHTSVKVRYYNGSEEVERILKGWTARVFQHELDHLNGVLFVERFAQFWLPKQMLETNDGLSNSVAQIY